MNYTIVNNFSEKKTRWVSKLFDHIEKNGLEEAIKSAKPGERVLIVSGEMGKQYFCCTGVRRGYFLQRLEDSGMYLHDKSPEFTF